MAPLQIATFWEWVAIDPFTLGVSQNGGAFNGDESHPIDRSQSLKKLQKKNRSKSKWIGKLGHHLRKKMLYMGVSKNNGTPKSSIQK